MSIVYDAPIVYDSNQPYNGGATWGSAGVLAPIIPHLSAAMVLGGDGTFVFWQQGTIDEVAQSVEMICGTTVGDRTVVPRFGLPQLPFNQKINQNQIVNAINTWEDRANVKVTITLDDAGYEAISVNTSIRRGSTSS